jgi:glutamate racemase
MTVGPAPGEGEETARVRPVGIFDSGVGGLTVHRRISERLPGVSLIYLGDTARVPYGTKSAETVIRYARNCASLLVSRGVGMLVVACNTASAFALDTLRNELPLPVLGVVEPGADSAVAATRSGRIGVIGTRGTVASGAYQRAIAARSPGAKVFCQACPLFVPLAEEGWTDGEVPERVARAYLDPLLEKGVDTLVLGCTHYPLLREVIARVAGPYITLVDSAEATAEAVARMTGCGPNAVGPPTRTFLATDAPDTLREVGTRFLGAPIEMVEWVDVR